MVLVQRWRGMSEKERAPYVGSFEEEHRVYMLQSTAHHISDRAYTSNCGAMREGIAFLQRALQATGEDDVPKWHIGGYLEEGLQATITEGHGECFKFLLDTYSGFLMPISTSLPYWISKAASNGHPDMVLNALSHPSILESLQVATSIRRDSALCQIVWACSNHSSLDVVFVLLRRRPDLLLAHRK